MSSTKKVACSFCGFSVDNADVLIRKVKKKGADVVICNKCIEQCHAITEGLNNARNNLFYNAEQKKPKSGHLINAMEVTSGPRRSRSISFCRPIDQLAILDKTFGASGLRAGNTPLLIDHVLTRRPLFTDRIFVIPKPRALAGNRCDNHVYTALRIILDHLPLKLGKETGILSRLRRNQLSAQGWYVQEAEQQEWYERELKPHVNKLNNQVTQYAEEMQGFQSRVELENTNDKPNTAILERCEEEIQRLRDSIEEAQKLIEPLLPGDYYVIWGQDGFALNRCGKSPRLVEALLNLNEFGFGLYEYLVSMLVNPGLLKMKANMIKTICSGDRYWTDNPEWPMHPTIFKDPIDNEWQLDVVYNANIQDTFTVPTFIAVKL